MSSETSEAPRERRAWFRRYARIAAAGWVALMLLGMDLAAGTVYRAATGHTFFERPVMLSLQREAEVLRTPSEYYSHDLRPGVDGHETSWGGLRYTIHTNEFGFKDRSARRVPLRSENHRILFIGDSFTEGVGYPYESTFVGLIDSALAEQDIEVLNAGVMSYSPIIYWKKLEYWIGRRGLEVDEVVVYLDVSDAHDASNVYRLHHDGTVDHFESARHGIVADRPQSRKGLAGVADTVRDRTVVIATIARLKRILMPRPTPPGQNLNRERAAWTIDDSLFAAFGEEGMRLMTIRMDSLHAFLQSREIPLTVAVYPWPDQIAAGDRDSRHVLAWSEWASSRNVRFINHFQHFVVGETREARMENVDRYYVQHDVHWNDAGHRLVAETFLDKYRQVHPPAHLRPENETR